MGIFDTDSPSTGTLSVYVPPMTVYISRVTWPEGGADPTWGNWTLNPRLEPLGAFLGSSFGGMSYATVRVAPGRPIDNNDTRLEDLDTLVAGDRVAICRGLKGSGDFKVLFVGYHTAANINVDGAQESMTLRLAGPEWLWGESAGGGSYRPIVGQWRLKASADDDYIAGDMEPTPFEDLFNDQSVRCVFNPAGRRNRISPFKDVELDDSGDPVIGSVWESPDRVKEGSIIADHWTNFDAIRTLVSLYNDQAITGIEPPDWLALNFPLEELIELDVDGLGLWGALRKILEPKYGFYVVPTQGSLNAAEFGPFPLVFFSRSSESSETIPLNPFNTAAVSSEPGVSRLEAVKDIAKTCTRIEVLGRELKHIRLQYHGAATNGLASGLQKLCLQHGWTNQNTIATYQTGGIVETAQIDAMAQATRENWQNRHCTNGKEFSKYAHVFRLFFWNEANELHDQTFSPIYGSTAVSWFAPDLGDIVTPPGETENYTRRRRPLLDTPYIQPGVDGWLRVPPSVFIAAQHPANITMSPWFRLPTSAYRLDPERAALWITVPDIADWRPLIDHRWAQIITGETGEGSYSDARTFATLLHSGKLRLMIEGSIETDWPMKHTAGRGATAGSPFTRVAVIRRQDDYTHSTEYTSDGSTSPMGLTLSVADASGAAQAFADAQLAAAQDQQCHASISTEADYPLLDIGTLIEGTSGRVINLKGGPSGRGAQVVGIYLDMQVFKIEYMTESVALQLRDVDRARIDRLRGRRVGRRGIGNAMRAAGVIE